MKILLKMIFLIILLLTILLKTDIGLILILKALPGDVSIKKISGSILDGWSIKKFSYKNSDISCYIDSALFNWQYQDLLKEKISITNISIKDLSIFIPTSSNTGKTRLLTKIHIPVDIDIKQASIENIKITSDKKIYVIDKIRTSAALINDHLSIKNIYVKNKDISTETHGEIDLNGYSIIKIENCTTFNVNQNINIKTHIYGNRKTLNITTKSEQWMDVNIILNNYLHPINEMNISAHWYIDTSKTLFQELKKLNGKLKFSGKVKGNLLSPEISIRLRSNNLYYDNYSINRLNGDIDFNPNKDKKINLNVEGKNIVVGEKIINTVKFLIKGNITSHIITLNLQTFNNEPIIFSGNGGLDNKNTYLLKNARCKIEQANITLYPINLKISIDQNHQASYGLHLHNNQEELLLTGTTLLNATNPTTKIVISTPNFTVINISAYKITAGTNINLSYDNSVTKINGQVNILQADINPADFSDTVTVTPDIIYVNALNEPLSKKSEPLKWFIDLAIKIQNFKISYKGLNANIIGHTTLSQTPSTDLAAFGQLIIIEGSYKAYGQALTIQHGSSINFIHNIDNPQLNITASKNISVSSSNINLPSYQQYLIAGVKILGTADAPNISFFSDPAGISQQDILSYLLFGYPQNQLTNSQASALWGALNMINNDQSSYSLSGLQKSIKHEFGFSEFGLGNTSEYNASTGQYESGTAFVVGKRITERLTATYSMGLLVPVNVLYLRYQLSQNWSLQSDSSALGNGGDIFYTIRRD